MNFDFDEIDTKSLSDSGVDMPVKKLNSQDQLIARNGQPVSITLLGPDSDVYRDFTRAQVKKRLARAKDAASLTDIDLAEADTDSLEMIVACTVGWKNVLDTKGKEIEFSKDAARAMYTGYPVIREQADAFIVDRARFIKASSAN